MIKRVSAAISLLAIGFLLAASPITPSQASVGTTQNGADVSWLPEIERAGSRFYDAKGHRVGPLKLMKQ